MRRFHEATVVDKTPETADSLLLTLSVPEDSAADFVYEQGPAFAGKGHHRWQERTSNLFYLLFCRRKSSAARHSRTGWWPFFELCCRQY